MHPVAVSLAPPPKAMVNSKEFIGERPVSAPPMCLFLVEIFWLGFFVEETEIPVGAHDGCINMWKKKTKINEPIGGFLRIFLCSPPKLGEDFQFDPYFSDELKQTTNEGSHFEPKNWCLNCIRRCFSFQKGYFLGSMLVFWVGSVGDANTTQLYMFSNRIRH